MRCVNVNKLARRAAGMTPWSLARRPVDHISDDPHELLIKQENNEDFRFIEDVSA